MQDKDLWNKYDQKGIPTILIRPCYGFNWKNFVKDFNNDTELTKETMRNTSLKEKREKPNTYWGFDDYPVLTHFIKFPDDDASYDEDQRKDYIYDLKGFHDHLEYIQGELNFDD